MDKPRNHQAADCRRSCSGTGGDPPGRGKAQRKGARPATALVAGTGPTRGMEPAAGTGRRLARPAAGTATAAAGTRLVAAAHGVAAVGKVVAGKVVAGTAAPGIGGGWRRRSMGRPALRRRRLGAEPRLLELGDGVGLGRWLRLGCRMGLGGPGIFGRWADHRTAAIHPAAAHLPRPPADRRWPAGNCAACLPGGPGSGTATPAVAPARVAVAPGPLIGAAAPPIVVLPPPMIVAAAAPPPVIFAPPAFGLVIAPPVLAFASIEPWWWQGGFIRRRLA